MTDYNDYSTILVEKPEPRVGILWFNRPEKRNCISPDLSREMNDVLPRLAEDDDIRALVVSGKGTAFCAGMDLKVFYEARNSTPTWNEPGAGPGDWWKKLREFPKPTIAAVNGHAYGGGFMTITCCDMAIVANSAQAGLSEINFGSPPGGGGTRAAVQMLLPKDYNYVLSSGLPLPGSELERIGFVNESVPDDQLMARSLEIARVCAKHHPIANKWLKKQILGSERILDWDLGIEYEHMMLAQMSADEGYAGSHEGFRAFIEKEYKPGLEALDFDEERPALRGQTRGDS